MQRNIKTAPKDQWSIVSYRSPESDTSVACDGTHPSRLKYRRTDGLRVSPGMDGVRLLGRSTDRPSVQSVRLGNKNMQRPRSWEGKRRSLAPRDICVIARTRSCRYNLRSPTERRPNRTSATRRDAALRLDACDATEINSHICQITNSAFAAQPITVGLRYVSRAVIWLIINEKLHHKSLLKHITGIFYSDNSATAYSGLLVYFWVAVLFLCWVTSTWKFDLQQGFRRFPILSA